jgi:hypothetical protein
MSRKVSGSEQRRPEVQTEYSQEHVCTLFVQYVLEEEQARLYCTYNKQESMYHEQRGCMVSRRECIMSREDVW